MKQHIFFYTLLVLICFSMEQLHAADNHTDSLVIRYCNNTDEVKLRWAPSSPLLWQIGKNDGFILEKITLRENGRVIEHPEAVMVTGNAIMPAGRDAWIAVIDRNDQAAIIAQAFWGESFQLKTKNSKNKSVSVLDNSIDAGIRFAFSLLAADMNFEAATLAGWGFTDKNVTRDGLYKYRVRLNHVEKGDSVIAETVVDMTKEYHLPAPFGLIAQFDENIASISWELSFTNSYYTAYNIERSTDNKNFKRLNSTPFIVSASSEDQSPAKRGEYRDSIPNDITYYYRINGIDCFGQTGPYSRVLSGKGFRRLKAVPSITSYKYKEAQRASIYWNFNKEQEDLITGFEVYRAEKIEGPFDLISKLLPPDTREFEFEMVPSNYLAVKAIGIRKDDVSVSGVYFLDQPDTTPPSPPVGLQGKIDTSGVVTLWWKPNKEKDLDGYNIYWSRFKGEEFVLMNVTPVKDTLVHDTLSLKTFVEHINYEVRATDKHSNLSKPSKMLVLKLPDIIKPVSPYFVDYRVNSDSVTLKWVNSGSSDVAFHLLYRKTEIDTTWKILARFDTLGIKSYTDHHLEERKSYSYLLIAVDDDGLESAPSTPAKVYVPVYRQAPPVENFTVTLDREKKKVIMRWKKNSTIKGFQLFKQEGDFAPYMCQFFEGKEDKFTDKDIKPFQRYTYKMRTMGTNGLFSPFQTATVQW